MNNDDLVEALKSEGYARKIIEAFAHVRRENFVPQEYKERSYENTALPIGHGQTISQPSTIAFMLSQLKMKQGQKILEIGSGCGYVLALMSAMTKYSSIIGVERVEELVELSRQLINSTQVEIIHANGFHGLKERAPFDRILVSAAADHVNHEIIAQLFDGGICVMPVKDSIHVIRRKGKSFLEKKYPGYAFVPLMG
jgi:protein-L-isoaspartate(D-aspartate) O-methyltransferase